MNKKQETRIIRAAVRKAATKHEGRQEIARHAAILADAKGVNVQVAPYLQDIFCEALDTIN